METYVFNANAAKQYKNILSGGAGLDKYIFNVQDGNGIGSFFAPLLKAIIPIAKTLGGSIMRAAKPVARAAAREAIKGGASTALGSLVDKTVQSVQHKKRKASTKRSSVKRPRVAKRNKRNNRYYNHQ